MDARRPHPLGAVTEEGEGGPRRQELSGTTRKVATIAGFAANQFHGMGLICFLAIRGRSVRLTSLFEIQRQGVHTVAQTSIGGPIRKHMTQMRVTLRTGDLGTDHAVA